MLESKPVHFMSDFVKCLSSGLQYTGVHITFLVSYSGEYQEMVFGKHPTHTPHVTSDLVKRTKFHKGDYILWFHFSIFFLNQTAATWPRSVWISNKRNVVINWFCTVLQCVRSAHECTFQDPYHSFRATSHLARLFDLLLRLCLPAA